MKLSVIIPYWNPDSNAQTDALLMRAVRSAQDSRPFEIIVVNDGSPSDPDLSSFTEVRYLRREHGMLGATRNTGIQAATGDAIAFLDADDYYYPGALKPCLEAMESTGADLLGFGHSITANADSIDSVKTCCGPSFSDPVTGDEFMRSNNLFGSACQYLISRKLINDNALRFKEGVYIEDEEFTPRLLFFSKKFIRTDYPVYAYYVHSGTIITTQTQQMTDLKAKHMIGAIGSLQTFCNEHSAEPHQGLDRKIKTLAIDHLRRTLRRKDWRAAMPAQIQELQRLGLFPVPTIGLPFKFRLFGLFSRCRFGRYLLHLTESLYK
ncbi:MAG: glycosyltransferase [Bacteroidaceae bacterium]|nr:glycosyltransferase [Bacteroidaceae bacterium]